MKAIILAAGMGTRLIPKTEKCPKCLLEVNGMTILEHQLNALRANNIKDVTIVLGHEGNKIIDFIGRKNYSDLDVNFITNDEYKNTNSSYSLWLAREELKDGFIYLNSDLLFHPDILKKLLDSEHEDAIIIRRTEESKSDMFKIRMNDNKIVHMDKFLESFHGEAIGPVKFSKQGSEKVISRLNHHIENLSDYSNWCYKIFSDISKEHDFFGIECGDLKWQEVDTHEDLEAASLIMDGSRN